MKLTLFLVLALCVSQTFARCPGTDGACSGHGECSALDKCICHSNFQGVGCSERVCPFSVGWSAVHGEPTGRINVIPSLGHSGSTARRADPTHGYTECGGRGVCDRTSGECQCDIGFEGRGCSRMSCPNACSDHGTCKYINRMNPGMVSWDKTMIQQCQCDPGYTGHDCSERMCPLGDDPMKRDSTASGWYSKYTLERIGTPQADEEIYFTFTDMYGHVWPTRALTEGTMTKSQIEEAFQSLPMNVVPKANVVIISSTEFTIEFTEGAGPVPQHSALSLGVVHKECVDHGCQPVSRGLATGRYTVAVTNGNRVLSVCSSRGKCDSSSGLCMCESGYYGEDCSKQTTVR